MSLYNIVYKIIVLKCELNTTYYNIKIRISVILYRLMFIILLNK